MPDVTDIAAVAGMPQMLVKLVLKWIADDIPPNRWKASKDGQRIGPILEAKCGLKGTTFWCRFEVEEDDGHTCKLEGIMPLEGGADVVTCNGEDVDADDVAISWRWVGFSPVLLVIVKYEQDGQEVRYRFDGKAL